jgi:hypothetical protein
MGYVLCKHGLLGGQRSIQVFFRWTLRFLRSCDSDSHRALAASSSKVTPRSIRPGILNHSQSSNGDGGCHCELTLTVLINVLELALNIKRAPETPTRHNGFENDRAMKPV